MRIMAVVVASTLLAVSAAEARTVVRMEGNVKVITMQTARGTAVIRCDRNNVPISSNNADGLNLRDICRSN